MEEKIRMAEFERDEKLLIWYVKSVGKAFDFVRTNHESRKNP